MAIIIKTNSLQGEDVLISDLGIIIPANGEFKTFSTSEDYRKIKESLNLIALATDNAFGESSTLIINDGTNDIAQEDVESFLSLLDFSSSDSNYGIVKTNATGKVDKDVSFDGSARITGLPTPVSGSDAVRKSYVDSYVSGAIEKFVDPIYVGKTLQLGYPATVRTDMQYLTSAGVLGSQAGIRMARGGSFSAVTIQVDTVDASQDYKVSIKVNGVEVDSVPLTSGTLGNVSTNLSGTFGANDVVSVAVERVVGDGPSGFNAIHSLIEYSDSIQVTLENTDAGPAPVMVGNINIAVDYDTLVLDTIGSVKRWYKADGDFTDSGPAGVDAIYNAHINNPVEFGAPLVTAGGQSYSFSYDGTETDYNSVVVVPVASGSTSDLASLWVDPQYTISMWFKRSAIEAGWSGLFGKFGEREYIRMTFYSTTSLYSTGKFKFEQAWNQVDARTEISETYLPHDLDKHHICIVAEGPGLPPKVYFDGNQITNFILNQNLIDWNNHTDIVKNTMLNNIWSWDEGLGLVIGGESWGQQSYANGFNGDIDDFMIFGKSLTSEEVLALYSGSLG